MDRKFTQEQLCTIAEQAMLTQCACPSMLSKVVADLQTLYVYQHECLLRDDVEIAVHFSIGQAIESVYPALERCLLEVLELEQWDLATLEMPERLRAEQIQCAGSYQSALATHDSL